MEAAQTHAVSKYLNPGLKAPNSRVCHLLPQATSARIHLLAPLTGTLAGRREESMWGDRNGGAQRGRRGGTKDHQSTLLKLQTARWAKCLQNVTNEVLLHLIYKELVQINKKNTKAPQIDGQRTFRKEETQMQINMYMGRHSTSLVTKTTQILKNSSVYFTLKLQFKNYYIL